MLLNLTPALYFLNCILGDLQENQYSVPQEAQITLTEGPDLQVVFEQNHFGLVRKFEIGFQNPLRGGSSNTLHVALSQRVPVVEAGLKARTPLKDFSTTHNWEFYIHEAWDYAPLQTMAEQLLAAALEFLEFASVPEHFNPTR